MIENRLIDKNDDNERTSIVLPLKSKDLGNFISSLLGQQQSIEREIDANFDIDHAWLVNLHELLHQRINQQADAHLVSFSAVIYFGNGLKRNLTTIEAFKTYNETKKNIPIGIKLIWSYLIQFPGRSYPEKQQISFSAQMGFNAQSDLKFKNTLFQSIIGVYERSTIGFNIEHTERTWGDDLEVIISNQVDQIIRGSSIKDTLLNTTRYILAAGIFVFCLIYPILSTSGDLAAIINNLYKSFLEIQSNSGITLDLLDKKINSQTLILHALGTKDEKPWLILLLFLGPIFSVVSLIITKTRTSSFLVLSKESEKHRTKKIRSDKRSYLVVMGSYIFAILAGIIANYGYSWLNFH
ncbi:hypothetical protein FCL47_20450 [Desulfopila sp. IMCC35006]|uniref:hypothetical protein n=1 Tax=Desulfopila sp. IMCC35006 TaxID=2569542 RepID=UPI0010AC8667|nr:hypothetical protein [Desulfopila sp. IMCC35006]TKB23854.1 hypothetical protein FCL47_20450 [Desulfopila sp. IMCC35006]